MNDMPKVNLSQLSRGARMFASEITKPDGTLYASKPVNASPEARYIWRMVVFYVSPRSRHHCMPVTAEWELGVPWEERRALVKELDVLVDQIVNAVPMHQWGGVIRWGHALGRL